MEGECGIDQEQNQEWRADIARAPQHGAHDGKHGERHGQQARPAQVAGCGRFAPGGQLFGIQCRTDAGSEYGQILAQIEHGPHLVDRLLPGAQLVDRGAGHQPVCQHLLARPRARRAQKLEQGALAEQVQVIGVRMMFVAKTFAGFALAHPAVVQARHPGLVDGHCAVAGALAIEHAFMDHGEHNRSRQRRQQEPG